jgi:hypothetical protein
MSEVKSIRQPKRYTLITEGVSWGRRNADEITSWFYILGKMR